jgi:hypothetical protein
MRFFSQKCLKMLMNIAPLYLLRIKGMRALHFYTTPIEAGFFKRP